MSGVEVVGLLVAGVAAGYVASAWRQRDLMRAAAAARAASDSACEAATAAWEQARSAERAVQLCNSEREHLNRSVMTVAREHGVDLPERRGQS